MDLNQAVWDALRAQGHRLGEPYIQEGAGLMVIVDDVSMSVKDARAIAEKQATVSEIAKRDNPDRLTSHLHSLVADFQASTVSDILVQIDADYAGSDEIRRKAMRSIRFSLTHRRPPDDLVPADVSAIAPLIVTLVGLGLEQGGLPDVALAGFGINPATPH